MRGQALRIAAAVFLILGFGAAGGLAAIAPKADWQAEWEKTVTAATKEGQVTVYGRPATSYQNAIGAFHSAFPKIKLDYIPGSGTNNARRLVTERRAGKR